MLSLPQDKELAGTVLEIRFPDREDTWSPGLLTVVGPTGRRSVNVVGKWISAHVGDTVKLEGQWNHNPKWGPQFSFTAIEVQLPTSREAALAFMSHRLPEVGPTRAAAILDRFGDSVWDVIENDHRKLEDIAGITKERALEIRAAYEAFKHELAIHRALDSWGFTPGQKQRIWRVWGDQSLKRLELDPYVLFYDIDGFGFQAVDKLATGRGMSHIDDRRMAAALYAAMLEYENEGHCYASEVELLLAAAKLAGIYRGALEAVLWADACPKLRRDTLPRYGGDLPVVYRSVTFASETTLASSLVALRDTPFEPSLADMPNDLVGALLANDSDDTVASSTFDPRGVEAAASCPECGEAVVADVEHNPPSGETALVELSDEELEELCESSTVRKAAEGVLRALSAGVVPIVRDDDFDGLNRLSLVIGDLLRRAAKE